MKRGRLTRGRTTLRRNAMRRKNIMRDESDEDEEEFQVRKKPLKRTKKVGVEEEEEDEDDDEEDEEEDDEEEDDDEDEEEADDDEEDDEEDEEEEEEEEADIQQRRKGAEVTPSKRTPPAKTQNKRTSAKEEKPASTTVQTKKNAVENEKEEADEPMEDAGVDESVSVATATEEEETKSEATSATATPSASPVRRRGVQFTTESATSSPLKAEDAMKSAGEVPYQKIRERLQAASSEQELLTVLTDLCGRVLKEGKHPSRLFAVGLLSAVKQDVERFCQPSVLKYLLRLLRSKHYSAWKDSANAASGPNDSGAKKSSMPSATSAPIEYHDIPFPVLIANVLVQLLKNQNDWPVDSFKVFLDDSIYARMWVDHELSQLFVKNVKTALHRKASTDSPQPPPPQGDGSDAPLPLVRQRFHGQQVVDELRDLSLNHLRARLTELEKEKSGGSISSSLGISSSAGLRNLILTLIDFIHIPQARVLAAENMESWLQNASVKGPSKELLSKLVSSCKTTEQLDLTTVDMLLKMKLKSTMFQIKVETITQLVRQNPTYLRLALAVFIARERPNNLGKDVDNMKILQHIFRAARTSASSMSALLSGSDDSFYKAPLVHQGALASRELARVFRELASTSDVAPVLKTIVRKILKQLTFEQVDIKSLCVGILENEGHWDIITKYGDTRLLDYMSLVTGIIWLVLLMRGAAVKSLQIQHANASGRQGSGTTALGGPMKLGGSQSIPRRQNQSIGASRTPKMGGRGDGAKSVKGPMGKQTITTTGNAPSSTTSSPGSTPSGNAALGLSNTSSGGADSSKTVKIAVRAREELSQAMAYVQREAVICCRDIFKHFSLNGASSFEKLVYESIVKKLLFLDIPADVQPTEHDKTCFLSTKEEIPLHDETLALLTSLFNSCSSIDRVEALQTLEIMVMRAAEGHMSREVLWRSRESDLGSYSLSGGVLGLEIKSPSFVKELFRLAHWPVNDQHSEHEYCLSSRFWISCSILLIIACFNPNTVGDFVWREIPTLRCLMQVIITGRYSFPPINDRDPLLLGTHNTNFTDVVQGNLQLREYEQQLMVQQAAQGVAVGEDAWMLLQLDGIARQPPPAIMEHIHNLDRKFKLGMRLRQSRTKDFLMEMIAENDSWDESGVSPENSAWWIADIVCEDFSTVQYLPYGCLCKLLLLAQREGRISESQMKNEDGSKTSQQLALIQIVPRLLTKLRESLLDELDAQGTASNIVVYYLDCLSSSDSRIRRIASRTLCLLTQNSSEAQQKSFTLEQKEVMTFDWFPELLKLPCYSTIRVKIFAALESVLERESSIPSLELCLKALYDFWKGAGAVGGTSNNEDQNLKVKPAGTPSMELSIQLAGTLGRLLSGREFISRLLLKNQTTYSIMLEVLWAVIEHQLVPPAQLKAKMTSGMSFSDCKVFYVADATQNVREIKLPLHVIHGAIHILCSPNACEDGTATSSLFQKLTVSLFPVAPTSGAAIISSTGLIATKDARLCPDHLLLKLAMRAPTAHLCAAAVKAMSSEASWALIQSAGLNDLCLISILSELSESTHSNEGKSITGLLAATQKDELPEAASSMRLYLQGIADNVTRNLSSSADQQLRTLLKWLSSKIDTKEERHDQELEGILLSGFFQSVNKVKPKHLTENVTPQSFYSKPLAIEQPGKQAMDVDEGANSSADELKIFQSQYFRAEEDISQLVPSLVENVSDPTSSSLPVAKRFGGSFFTYLITSIEGKCLVNHDETRADTWRLHIALLHALRSSCRSTTATSQLANALVYIVGHVVTCPSSQHRQDCSSFLLDALNSCQDILTYAPTLNMIRHLVKVCCIKELQDVDDLAIATDIRNCFRVILGFVENSMSRFNEENLPLALDSMTLYNVVAATKDVGILDRALSKSSVDTESKTKVLEKIAANQPNDAIIVNILDPVLMAEPQFAVLPNVFNLHADVRREIIGTLYFQNPAPVARHLDALHPGWETLINLHSSTSHRHQIAISDRQILDYVDGALKNLTQDNSDVMDRFREIIRRHPVLVLSRFPKQLLQLFGTASLTEIYLNTVLFQNILNAMEIVRPYMRAHTHLLAPFCQFIFEILDVIARHQATEFHQLIIRIWDIFYDAFDADYHGACEQLFQAKRCTLIRSVVTLYAAYPDAVAFGELFNYQQNPQRLRRALSTIDMIRNKQHSTMDQQQQVERFLVQVASVLPASSNAAGTTTAIEMSANEIEQSLQTINQLSLKSQRNSSTMPLLRVWAPTLSNVFFASNLTKPLISSLCQTLLNLMKADSSCVQPIIQRYADCLHLLRPGLKENAVTYVLEYLAFADCQQRREILQHLFDDASDIAKSKLVAYLKSAAFKTSLLPSIRTP